MDLLSRDRRALARAALAAALVAALAGCHPNAGGDTRAAAPRDQRSSTGGEAAARASSAERSEQDAAQPQRELDERIAASAPHEETAAIDPAAVGAIAQCTVCHGASGEGNAALDAPRIGGLDATYVARQLEHFRASVRGGVDSDKYGSQMRAIAITLDNDEVIADLARYLATLEPPYAQAETVEGDAAHGAELYNTCVACHGMDGRGSAQLNTPSLVGQYDWYLARQLRNFRERLRGAHPSDVYGMQMAPIVQASLMMDRDIGDVVAYIRTLARIEGERPEPPTQRGANGSQDDADDAGRTAANTQQ
jgi:cytochrome c oxidase subunit 2